MEMLAGHEACGTQGMSYRAWRAGVYKLNEHSVAQHCWLELATELLIFFLIIIFRYR